MEDLPSYTPEVLPGYDLTPATTRSPPSTRPSSPTPFLARARNHENFCYRSERMRLDLGLRRWGTRLPAYGKSGKVEGTVRVHSFSHVERIVVRLIGKMHASHVVNYIPTLSQSHYIIDKEIELWSAKAPSASIWAEEAQFPFSFTLDKEFEGTEDKSIPPSATIQLHRANARIAYAIKVDMYRRGLHMHEMIQTEVLHLPRTVAHYSRPFIPELGNEKRPSISESEWSRSQLQFYSGKGPKLRSDCQKAPELLLPRDLRFPSGEDIPFIVSIPETHESKLQVEIQLVRLSTVQTRAGAIQQAKAISQGRINEPSAPESTRTTVYGTISTGEAERDVSWNFGTLVSVSYEIRIGLSFSSMGSAWKLTIPIELTSHEWRGEYSAMMPSLGSNAASRTAVNLIHMNI
ncbi:unnamed protein product [Rhizoctonia solani]|uniref:Uncharacterized protein n=1 Tax=Rhizoctonia solani TaxID=456999 RepID=A0A8H3DH14_9AGAM|nr:unnamed protein product [Rhizoctonia solani]